MPQTEIDIYRKVSGMKSPQILTHIGANAIAPKKVSLGTLGSNIIFRVYTDVDHDLGFM